MPLQPTLWLQRSLVLSGFVGVVSKSGTSEFTSSGVARSSSSLGSLATDQKRLCCAKARDRCGIAPPTGSHKAQVIV